MKVYLLGERERQGRHALMVQPGNEYPNNSDWKDADGKPMLLNVEFIQGCAEVADNLGQYLLDKGLAKSSPILLPGGGLL